MFSNDASVQVHEVSKIYQVYGNPQDRLKQSIVPRLRAFLGKQPKVYYNEFWALRNVSLDVKKGETVGIIGRNGSGKSTLLQMITGVLTPTSGKVETKGRITALLELGSGFNPEFTGRDNVYLNGAILGLEKAEIEARFKAIADFAGIGDFMDRPIKTYSSGMVVRLAFSVQAMVDPEILIVDEALAVGDEKFQRKCFARLDELKRNGTSILFVSHSTVQITELCDRALLLEQGERILFGQPADVVKAYQKLIYSPEDVRLSLVDEYKKQDLAGKAQINSHPAASVVVLNDAQGASSDYYDPGLVPDTTVVYPQQGGEITTLHIFNLQGEKVNILSFGQEYFFEISGNIHDEREIVYFGFHIRTLSGIAITGLRYPENGKYVERIAAGTKFKIRYRLKLSLAPGTYFAGGGIWSEIEPTCLHRIVDAVMFRIVASEKNHLLGYVDISSAAPSAEITL